MTIPEILTAHNLTQSQLSRMTGIPLRTVQGWCLGERKPPEWLPKLINAYILHTIDPKRQKEQS